MDPWPWSLVARFPSPHEAILLNTLIVKSDHFNVDGGDDGSHTLIVCEDFIDSEVILGKEQIDPVLFLGTGFAVADGNPLVIPVLQGSSSSYVYQLSEVKMIGTLDTNPMYLQT